MHLQVRCEVFWLVRELVVNSTEEAKYKHQSTIQRLHTRQILILLPKDDQDPKSTKTMGFTTVQTSKSTKKSTISPHI